MSSGSIISTASSNSHKRDKRKRQQQADPLGGPQSSSLQVAGMKLGSNRKGYIPSKYEKSPFLGGQQQLPQKQHSDFLAANSISLSGDGNGGGSSQSVNNIGLSMAARKREMQLQAEKNMQVIEKNKKQVLEALNKNYGKKAKN